MALDLGNTESIKAFSGHFLNRFSRLDVLINNAGVMMPPKKVTTQDHWEV